MEQIDISKIVDEGVLLLAECINKMMKLEKEIERLRVENDTLRRVNADLQKWIDENAP